MAVKALNIKMDDSIICDIKTVASVFHMSMTDVFKEALGEYIAKMKHDPFYRLTANVQDASDEEITEILGEINSLTDDDLLIANSKTFGLAL